MNGVTYLTPEAKNIGFNSTTRRTIIEKSGDATVNFERRDVKQTPLESIDYSLSESLTVSRATTDSGLKLLLNGGFLELQFIEKLNGCINLRLGCFRSLESSDSVSLSFDG